VRYEIVQLRRLDVSLCVLVQQWPVIVWWYNTVASPCMVVQHCGQFFYGGTTLWPVILWWYNTVASYCVVVQHCGQSFYGGTILWPVLVWWYRTVASYFMLVQNSGRLFCVSITLLTVTFPVCPFIQRPYHTPSLHKLPSEPTLLMSLAVRKTANAVHQ
jgi:hypothetical protein